VYNVAPYLDDFLTSLTRQTWFREDSLEVLLVDDGSSDASGAICQKWAARYPNVINYHYKPNGGLASARNAGIRMATGQWIGFPDPDDLLAPQYLESVVRSLEAVNDDSGVSLVACYVKPFIEKTYEVRDDHPLNGRFEEGVRLSRLKGPDPDIHVVMNAAFFRRDHIQEQALECSEHVRPHGEDLHFTARYVATFGDPHALFAADAVYYYRKRASQDSAMNQAGDSEALYTTLIETCIVDLLNKFAPGERRLPVWLQRLLLYHIGWHVRRGIYNPKAHEGMPEATIERHKELVDYVLAYLDVDVIDNFAFPPLDQTLRDALVAGFKGARVLPQRVVVEGRDRASGGLTVSWLAGDDSPPLAFYLKGAVVEPAEQASKIYRFCGEPLANEYRTTLDWPGVGEWTAYSQGQYVPFALRGGKTVSKLAKGDVR
jgi:glycosyltransferase involved in cell wall biosynthesis